jgi:hypothetical protein
MGSTRVFIPYTPRPWFKAFHARKQRFSLIAAARRAGKTVATINDDIKKISKITRSFPVPQAAFISPTFSMGKRNAWAYAKHYTSSIPGMKAREGELTLEFPNGGKYIFAGSDNYDSLRGLYLDHATLDEFGSHDPRVWSEVVRPALSDYAGTATFIGSAHGRNHFYDLMKQHEDDPDWYVSILRASEIKHLAEDELDLARNTMTPEQYRSEFEVDFDSAVIGTFYGAEISLADVQGRIGTVLHDRAADVFAAWDLGLGGATAIWLFQRIGAEWHFISYYEGFNPDSGLQDAVDWIKIQPFKVIDNFLPHDAEAHELMLQGTTRKQFLESRGLCCTTLTRSPLEDGINTVRVNFNKFFFDKRACAQGIDSLRMYRTMYDPKKKVFSEKPVHDWASHAADALRYAVMAMPNASRRTDWNKPIIRNLRVVA